MSQKPRRGYPPERVRRIRLEVMVSGGSIRNPRFPDAFGAPQITIVNRFFFGPTFGKAFPRAARGFAPAYANRARSKKRAMNQEAEPLDCKSAIRRITTESG